MKFVDKQIAIKLKEKGFDKPCFGYYYIETPTGFTDGELVLSRYYGRGGTFMDTLKRHDLPYTTSNIIDAPAIEQVLEWLREEKKIHVNVNALPSLCKNYISVQEHRLIFDVRVSYFEEELFKYYDLDEPYFKYEDACIAGIEYVINNLI